MTLMTKILIFKEAFKKLYSRNSMYINPVVRFVATLFTLLIINNYTGNAGVINSPVASIVIAAVCSLLPMGVIVVIVSLFTILNIYYLAAEMAIVAVVIYLVMYIFYFRFSSRYGYLLLVVPMLMFIKISYIIPLFVGIALNPAAIVSMVFGIIIFYMLKGAGSQGVKLSSGNNVSGIDSASALLKDIIQNREMITILIAFVLAALIVYGIKRMEVDYSSTIGIIVGGIVELAIIVVAAYIMELEGFMPIWLTGVLAIASIIAMYFLQYLVLAVDYAGTEYTQFEDDDYYYYVKAVPKVKVKATDVKVRHINSKR